MVVVLIIVVTAALSIVMTTAWAVQRWTHNAGWVDTIWTFGLGAAGVAYALMPVPGIAWPGTRQLFLAAIVATWSLRLGLHLAERTRRGPEDTRYAQFRAEWGANFELRMFRFLQVQAAAAAFLALSVLVAARNPAPLGFGDILGLIVFAMAIAGEALADRQLGQFRRDPAHHGKICDRGLWHWSRHPNYFFEWLGWLAYPLIAIDLSGHYLWGWLGLTAPAFIYVLLVYVSGIPPLEQQMLRSRGEAYRLYQGRTRPFLPLPVGTTSSRS